MLRNKPKYLLFVATLLLAGCAQVWVKPGASQSDFSTDRYTCLQESQQHQSSAAVNAYGGAAQSGSVTNGFLFNSCMNAKGWTLQQAQANAQDASQNSAELAQMKAGFREEEAQLAEKTKAVCSKPEYVVILANTTCSAKDITFAHIADSSKITQEQKTALPKYRTELDVLGKEHVEYTRTHGTIIDKQWADFLESVQPEIDKYNLDLYNGVITWGEYNQRRKDLTTKMQAEWRSRTQQK